MLTDINYQGKIRKSLHLNKIEKEGGKAQVDVRKESKIKEFKMRRNDKDYHRDVEFQKIFPNPGSSSSDKKQNFFPFLIRK